MNKYSDDYGRGFADGQTSADECYQREIRRMKTLIADLQVEVHAYARRTREFERATMREFPPPSLDDLYSVGPAMAIFEDFRVTREDYDALRRVRDLVNKPLDFPG